MRIQHNIMAMNAYRNYNTNTSALSKNLEKLSSGYKINRAGDDAAGLAISEKMRAQITGLNAAQKNVKDGISLVKTAEGAMQEIQDMLNRMDYLATQSSNGTYDNEVDRNNLQKEVNALKTEIDRIADSANFNGIKLLDGSLDGSAKEAVAASSKDATGMLPEVGKTLGSNTVLHKDAGTPATTSEFTVDLHNVKITGAKDTEFELKIGSTTITGKLLADADDANAIDSDAIAAALNGDASKIELKVGTAAYDKDNITFNGEKFSFAGDATTIKFSSTEAVDPDMAVSINLKEGTTAAPTNPATLSRADGTAAGTAPTVTVTGPTTKTVTKVVGDGTDKTSLSIDLAGASLDKAASKLTLTLGGKTVDSAAVADADKADASKLAAAFNGKTITVDGVTLTAAVTGTTVKFEAADATAPGATAELDAAAAANGALAATGVAAAATQGTATLDFTGKTGADVIGKSITVGDKTYEFIKTGGTASGTNVAVSVAEDATDEDIVDAFVTAATASKDAKVGTVAEDTAKKVKLTAAAAAGADSKIPEVTMSKGNAPATPSLSGDWNVSTTQLQKKGEAAGERLASTYFALTEKMAGIGNKITIGGVDYEFVKEGATGTQVNVGDLDLSTKEGLTEAAERLTKAAAANAVYTVGHDGTRLSFTEKETNTTDLKTLENIEKSFGFKTAAQAAVAADDSKALTLQIGDTADTFNQMKVSIGDMHTKALGIADLDISDPKSASAAIQTIRDAINNVSSVRGDLGAIQNRLEHTQNNLSVMAENIQDAESTIRDTDVAEEMMAYTKNNILIQSAQAMLAQANQVPQGVLQLLQ